MKITYLRAGNLLALLILGLVLCTPVRAADLQVTPTFIQFVPGEQSQSLWLINSGQRTLQAQVRLFAWSQSADEDILQPSQDFAISPVIVSVAAGQRQLVRIIRRAGAVAMTPGSESSYRLLVDELPVASQGPARQGVQFVFRYSLPLFVSHAQVQDDNQLSALDWRYRPTPDGLVLRVSNPGQRHIQIAGLKLLADSQQLSVHKGLFGYVLAGQTREWPIKVDNQAAKAIDRIRATVNGESVESSISLWSVPE